MDSTIDLHVVAKEITQIVFSRVTLKLIKLTLIKESISILYE